LFLAWASQNVPPEYLKYFGILLLGISLSFLYLYFGNLRLNATEAGGKTWWADYRLVFGALYMIAAIYSFQGRQKLVIVPLAMDVIFGFILFLAKRA